MEGAEENPIPSIKVEAAKEDDQDLLPLSTVAVKVRRFSASSDTSTTSTKSTKKMATVEATRLTLETKLQMLEKDLVELENFIKSENPDQKEVDHNLQWTKSQVEATQKVRQSLISLLLKQKSLNEHQAEEIQHRELARRFMKLEVQASELLQSLETPKEWDGGDGELATPDPVQLLILDDVDKLLWEEILELNDAVVNEDEDAVPELLVKVETTFGKYQRCFQEAVDALIKVGQRDTVLQRSRRDTQILKAKADWERKACLFLEGISPKDTSFQDAAANPNGFHYNRRDLPKLTGNVKDWLPFWALFKEVDEDRVLTDVQKMQLLLQSTNPNTEPRDVVSCYMVTNSYDEAVARLKDLYGRDNVLIKVYVRELLQLALDTSLGKTLEFRKLVTSITAQVKNLEMLGVAADKFAQILYPIIEACLPREVLTAWQHSPDYADELEKLTKFLKDEVNHETA